MAKEKKPKQELRGIIRIKGADLKGERNLFVSLQRIDGVGANLANAICKVGKFKRNKKVGTLTNEDIKKIEKILDDPVKAGIPKWMLNRKKDPKTGKDLHLSGADVKFTETQDIKGMINIKTYRGVRHMYGLPVRGQRTKSSFRGGKTVGYHRKKQQPKKKKGKK